jgi:formiminotetrahydrofolate cyclodeaminase
VVGVDSWSIDEYLDRLAAPHPTPASSHVAALNLAQGAALLAMVARVRADKAGVLARTSHVREAALRLAEADASVVAEVAGVFALPRTTEAERERRAAAIADALLAAAGPPAELVGVGAELVELCERTAAIASGALLGDVAAAADAAAAALNISRTNVEARTPIGSSPCSSRSTTSSAAPRRSATGSGDVWERAEEPTPCAAPVFAERAHSPQGR